MNFSKKFANSYWLVLLFLLNTVIVIHSAAIEPEGDHHSGHDHHDESEEIILKGHGEDCSGNGVKCNTGLVCMDDLNKCECPVGSTFSEDGKCEEKPVKDSPTHEHEDEHEDRSHEHDKDGHSDNVGILEHHPDHDHDHDHDEGYHTMGGNHEEKCDDEKCGKTLGKYSKCDEHKGECICADTQGQNRTVKLLNGKCFLEKKINDECSTHEECSATIKGKAWCHLDPPTLSRYCQCEMFHYYEDSLQECLPFAEDGLFSPCKTDLQCTGYGNEITGHGLGPNAKCSKETNICECKLRPDGQKGFMYENYCFYKVELNGPCSIDRECQVSLSDENAFCSEESKTCLIRSPPPLDLDGRLVDEEEAAEGNMIDSLKSAMGLDIPNFVVILIIGAIVLLVGAIILVFIVRKRHRYTMVRTRDTPDQSNHM